MYIILLKYVYIVYTLNNYQQYPPGAHNIFKESPTNNDVTENGKEARRAGGSEATKWPQPGSHEVALRGSEGVGGSP